ncbi:hypothetical protein [Streptomyces lanatus]|uniref:hypothetical protein n=1 Tax=Streptomyces lanatus TaxID=66900 RepID=UPI00357142AB
MHPETHLALHHLRAADLRAEADAYRLAAAARRPRDLRARLGCVRGALARACLPSRFAGRRGAWFAVAVRLGSAGLGG